MTLCDLMWMYSSSVWVLNWTCSNDDTIIVWSCFPHQPACCFQGNEPGYSYSMTNALHVSCNVCSLHHAVSIWSCVLSGLFMFSKSEEFESWTFPSLQGKYALLQVFIILINMCKQIYKASRQKKKKETSHSGNCNIQHKRGVMHFWDCPYPPSERDCKLLIQKFLVHFTSCCADTVSNSKTY